MNNSKLVKIMHIILFVITALYLLESIFLRGLFTNPLIALVNIIVAIIAMVIAFIKKEKKLAIIDLSILIVVSAILAYLMNL
ncbi:MAG: hypothetical protein ACLSDR_08675 [Clostridium sp.]